MTEKVSGRKIKCLCFHEDRAISTHLIHDAVRDSHLALSGCIAPGVSHDEKGIHNSATAMDEIWKALGGYKLWKKCKIRVENNIHGNETKEQWISRRRKPEEAREANPDPTR